MNRRVRIVTAIEARCQLHEDARKMAKTELTQPFVSRCYEMSKSIPEETHKVLRENVGDKIGFRQIFANSLLDSQRLLIPDYLRNLPL